MFPLRDELTELGRMRARLELAELDYQRALVRAAKHHTQKELADCLRLSQPSVSSALRTAERVAMPLDGRVSATPYEVCQRYAAGEMTRDEAIAELIDWPYVDADMHPSPGDDLVVIPPGTIDEVVHAAHDGLIDDTMYEIITRAVCGVE